METVLAPVDGTGRASRIAECRKPDELVEERYHDYLQAACNARRSRLKYELTNGCTLSLLEPIWDATWRCIAANSLMSMRLSDASSASSAALW